MRYVIKNKIKTLKSTVTSTFYGKRCLLKSLIKEFPKFILKLLAWNLIKKSLLEATS